MKEMDKILAEEVTEQANTEWFSTIVFVQRKDGSYRFCVHDQNLNAVVVQDSYPIPRKDKCIDLLGDPKIFLMLKGSANLWHIKVDEGAMDLIAFVTYHRLSRYKAKPFWMKASPATNHRAMDVILASMKWQPALLYLVDMVLFPVTPWQHTEQPATALKLIQSARLVLKVINGFFETLSSSFGIR